eukprot:8061818-Alexandrium_andersonii.AAC.1
MRKRFRIWWRVVAARPVSASFHRCRPRGLPGFFRKSGLPRSKKFSAKKDARQRSIAISAPMVKAEGDECGDAGALRICSGRWMRRQTAKKDAPAPDIISAAGW